MRLIWEKLFGTVVMTLLIKLLITILVVISFSLAQELDSFRNIDNDEYEEVIGRSDFIVDTMQRNEMSFRSESRKIF